ncbi:MAG TPA: DUF2254 domain-containing protein [Pirellulales bacterium]|nr:DUF2254 domain-containing protein [Pirellulales bacterium]
MKVQPSTVNGTEADQFVPHISVTIGLLLSLASVGVFIYFIHHAAESIQAENVIAAVSRDLHYAIDRLYPQSLGKESPETERDAEHERAPPKQDLPAGFDRKARPVTAAQSDYLQAVDVDRLLELAKQHDLVLSIEQRPGKFFFKGRDLVRVWPGAKLDDALAADVRAALCFGKRRTLVQDIEFAIDQLVEVAVRALSPCINDPFTAMNYLDRLGAALCLLAEKTIPSPFRYDDEGRLRVVTDRSSLAGIVDAAFNQIRQAARGNTSVTLRLLETITGVARHTRDPVFREALGRHAETAHGDGEHSIHNPLDRADVDQRYRDAIENLQGRSEPSVATKVCE